MELWSSIFWLALAEIIWVNILLSGDNAVVIALAAIYAEQAMHFTQIQTMVLIFLVNIASALGGNAFVPGKR